MNIINKLEKASYDVYRDTSYMPAKFKTNHVGLEALKADFRREKPIRFAPLPTDDRVGDFMGIPIMLDTNVPENEIWVLIENGAPNFEEKVVGKVLVRELDADGAHTIKVWAWRDAPQEYRDLSGHGGDEDWVALVPASYLYLPRWMDGGTPFGCCDVSEHKLENGDTVAIGAHA